MPDKPLALDAYEQLSEAFAAKIDRKAHNAFYDRPAVLSLLPEVANKRVLDAGCGPGAYAEWLVNNGAQVVGIDASPKMIQHASDRLKGRAKFIQADLGAPLDFLDSNSFDLVVSALAMDYIKDWSFTFAEFYRVLSAPGHLVFSVGHPADEFYDHHPDGNYFEIEQVAYRCGGFGITVSMPYYRRPLSAMINPVIETGFELERVLEPQPVPEFREHDPRDYEKLMRQPGFICFRSRKGRQRAY